MRKILIAFLMFTLSGPAFIAPTPTFAATKNTNSCAAAKSLQKVPLNSADRCNQTLVNNWVSAAIRDTVLPYCDNKGRTQYASNWIGVLSCGNKTAKATINCNLCDTKHNETVQENADFICSVNLKKDDPNKKYKLNITKNSDNKYSLAVVDFNTQGTKTCDDFANSSDHPDCKKRSQLYTLDSVVGHGSTESNAIQNWIDQAHEYMKQYCVSNITKTDVFQCSSNGGEDGEDYAKMIYYQCPPGNSCDQNKRNIDGRTICKIDKSDNYKNPDVVANFVQETHRKLMVKYDTKTKEHYAVLENSSYSLSSPNKFPGKYNNPIVASGGTAGTTTPAQPTESIKGKVVDEDGEPLQGAAVQIRGTSIGASVDADGIFEIKNHKWQENYVLEISFISYKTKTITKEPDVSQPIIMEEDAMTALGVDASGNAIEAKIENTLSNKPCCLKDAPVTCENCTINTQCSCTKDEYDQETCNNTDGIRDPVDSGHGPTCRPNKCIKPWFGIKLQSGTDRTHYYTCELEKSKLGESCKSEIKNFDPHATDGTIVEWDEKTGDVKQCTSTECEKDWDLFYAEDNIQRCKQSICPKELWSKYPNANTKRLEASNWDPDTNKTTECKITACDTVNGWVLSQKQNKCIKNECDCNQKWDNDNEECVYLSNKDTDCNKEIPGAIESKWACNKKGKSYCQLIKCHEDYKINLEQNMCISNIDCTKYAKEIDANVTFASWDDDKHTTCIIKACDNMYRVDKSSNTCVIKNDEDIGKLTEARDKARENEKSLQNRINGAVGIGGVGIGGMMIGGALSERSADDAAESDMRAYINTFRCEYGNGQNVAGGTTNVEIPGGNELIELYTKYATLANDLKLRKESLGLKPGIESEVIIDKATTGLYDDVGTGVVGGGYASIARAIMNPTGADAQMWAAQRAATASKLNTGIGIATTAAAASLAGNILNKLREPKPFTIIQPEKQPNLDCAQFNNPEAGYTLKGEYPHCECVVSDDKALENELVFNFDNNTCYKCEGDEKLIDYNGVKQCRCPEETPYGDYSTHRCYANPPTCEQRGYNTKNIPHLYFDANKNCKPDCTDDFSYNEDSHICECNSPKEEIDGKCTSVVYSHTQETIERNKTDVETDALSNDTLFELGKHTFKNENGDNGKKAQQTIQNWFKTNIANKKYKDCELSVVGHADTSGKNRNYDNKGLSERRAATVKTYLESQRNEKWLEPYLDPNVEIKSSGEGEQYCYCCKDDPNTCPSKSNKGNSITKCDPDTTKRITTDQVYAPCRRVEIKAKCRLITEEETNTSQTTITQ